MEIWKDIEGYETLYQVSDLGRIRRKSTGEIVHQYNNAGYKDVGLTKCGKTKPFRVHRLVAFAFCEGYEEGMVVNHKNEFKEDNRAENLEWCTQSYNVTYHDAQIKGRMKATTRPQCDAQRKEIGRKLRELRKSTGLKLGEAAARAVVSEGVLSSVETGNHSTSIDALLSIANTYGYTIELKKIGE